MGGVKELCEFPTHIITEAGDKLIPNTGNLLFLKNAIYVSAYFPVRILIDEGKETPTCTLVVYISEKNFICIDTSSPDKNFQSIIKIPIDTFDKLCYNGFKYKIYVKEVLTQ